ncbi:Pre-mRNA-splicing factor cef1 [Ceratobasidium sp. 392]|nr:Pre-mRNA-splicing factor cef1 [Ceratobasidium sp. 392]
MGTYLIVASPENAQVMQSALARVAGPIYQKDRMTEDEKLLHLAKLMPTQWRTIAPIVGRTATQCLERYQKLLDDAEAKENEELGLGGPEGGEAGPSADDIRRLRPGKIDPDPETKPAQPDPIDMDEDASEKKVFPDEARARLANTQGKKAKRKARERQLEEARRLAVLQKKRELKAAGIIMRHKAKKKGMDYNADIPFEKKPAPGFYDTTEEQAKSYSAPVGQSLRRLENKRKPQEEEAEAKKRQKKGKEGANEPHLTKFIAARDAQIQKLKEAEQISKRRSLVGEAELEEIVKIGQAGQSARALMNDEGEGNEASGRLLGEYEGLGHARMARTPRTAPQEDNIMAEARNLRNMVQAQTPLLDDESTPMHVSAQGGTGFEGATPRHQVAFTPNPLATPRANGTDVSDARVGATPLRTPMRDNLSINPEDGTPRIGDTPREERMRAAAAQRSLKLGFASLPKPSNDFEVVLPEDEEEIEEDERTMTVEDMAERNARMRKLQEEEERKALERRTNVVKRDLPRPVHVNRDQLLQALRATSDAPSVFSGAQALIDQELVDLIQHDTIAHPLPGTPYPGGTPSMYDMPDDEDVAAATLAVHAELSATLGIIGASPEEVKKGVVLAAGQEDFDDELLSWAHMRDIWAYDRNLKAWVDAATLEP